MKSIFREVMSGYGQEYTLHMNWISSSKLVEWSAY